MHAKKRIYCQIRQEWIKTTPEENVRQRLIYMMRNRLGYPNGSLGIELSLKEMPHLALYPGKLPARRADIVCFTSRIGKKEGLYPLLLIECKAIKLSPKVFNQALGYNYYLKAYFIAIANEDTVQTHWYDKTIQEYRSIQSLPSYEELLLFTQKLS
jgi:hypothetical protein